MALYGLGLLIYTFGFLVFDPDSPLAPNNLFEPLWHLPGPLRILPWFVIVFPQMMYGLLVLPAELVNRRTGRWFTDPNCANCGYDFRKASATQCPECGTLVEPPRYPAKSRWRTLPRK